MKPIDPLAQSFYVEATTGIFVTSVDLFFYKKDSSLPITIQLRPMELGIPTKDVYPFAEVVIDAKDVQISDNASLPTRVTFPSPVYLEGSKFHSLVVMSNSDQYNVWISKLGEIDVTPPDEIDLLTLSGLSDLALSRTIVVTKQPLTGGLFKSQNAFTWNESPYEDLKFNLYRANFKSTSGNITFYNSPLDIGNAQIANLLPNSLNIDSKKIRVGLGTTVQESGLALGNTIIQDGTNASGDYVGSAGSAFSTLKVINTGIGYSNGYYPNVPLVSLTGSGKDATANITIIDGAVTSTGATISNGGRGYSVGDIVTISGLSTSSTGRNLRLSVSNLNGINELEIDNVQGDFISGNKILKYVNNSGVTTALNSAVGGNVTIITDGIETITDGLHIRINHKNHGMYSNTNYVTISGVLPDTQSTNLTSDYERDASSELFVSSSTNFSSFESVGVGTTNPGYALIGAEVIAYTGITTNSLTGITRQIDETGAFSYPSGTPIFKYELDGISLRRVNKTHYLADAEIADPIGLDYYTIKIDTSSGGNSLPLPQGQVDRSGNTGLPKLHFSSSLSTGNSQIRSTQNIQYELIRPNVQTLILDGTNINAKVRTVTGRSVSGTESSFEDAGYQDITLNGNNYFNSPRLVCSRINEITKLNSIPQNKSIILDLALTTTNSYVSPAIDLDRVSMIFVSNRVNSIITDYAEDNRVNTLEDDPSAFVYATKSIGLETPATSIKIYVSAHVNIYNDIRAFYSVHDNPNEQLIYYPFPGFNNLTNLKQVIDPSLSDGTPDTALVKTDQLAFDSAESMFKDYEFTIDNIPAFRYFSIKLVGTSTNQAFPPRFRDLRVIALA